MKKWGRLRSDMGIYDTLKSYENKIKRTDNKSRYKDPNLQRSLNVDLRNRNVLKNSIK